MKIVFLPTAQFSGTRFLHYTVVPAVEHPQWQRAKIKITRSNIDGRYRAADTLIGLINNFQFAYSIEELVCKIKKRLSEEVLSPDGFIAAICSHISDMPGFISFKEQEKIMDMFKTAVTLRDPLAILLTTEARRSTGNEKSHHMNFDNYAALAKSKKPIFMVPVDLYKGKSFAARLELIEGLFAFLDIMPSKSNYIGKVASEWFVRGDVLNDKSVSNERKEYAALLKQYYQNGDIEMIKKTIPSSYAKLKEREPIIRPMLEKAGYKNLLWWD